METAPIWFKVCKILDTIIFWKVMKSGHPFSQNPLSIISTISSTISTLPPSDGRPLYTVPSAHGIVPKWVPQVPQNKSSSLPPRGSSWYALHLPNLAGPKYFLRTALIIIETALNVLQALMSNPFCRSLNLSFFTWNFALQYNDVQIIVGIRRIIYLSNSSDVQNASSSTNSIYHPLTVII